MRMRVGGEEGTTCQPAHDSDLPMRKPHVYPPGKVALSSVQLSSTVDRRFEETSQPTVSCTNCAQGSHELPTEERDTWEQTPPSPPPPLCRIESRMIEQGLDHRRGSNLAP